jgi:hypothetical protein
MWGFWSVALFGADFLTFNERRERERKKTEE